MRAQHPASSDPEPTGDDAVERFAFLASAGELLASSLDYRQTVQAVVRAAIPILGELCVADVLEDGQLRRVAAAYVDAAGAHELSRPDGGWLDQAASRVLRTGQADLLQTGPEAAQGPEAADPPSL
jgi:hypothetical protein